MILQEILQAVRDGERSFRPVSSSQEDMEAFQPIAKAFDFAQNEGYLDLSVLHEERMSANSWYDLVVVKRLTHEGDAFLNNPSPEEEQRLEEIVELRPNVFGVGINLRALWRRVRGQ